MRRAERGDDWLEELVGEKVCLRDLPDMEGGWERLWGIPREIP